MLCGVGAAVWEVDGVIWGLLIAYALTAVLSIADALRALPKVDAARGAADDPGGRERLREATGFGVRANAATALQFLNYRLDLFVLSAVASGTDLGLYATAVSVTGVMFLAPQTLAYVVFPRVAALSAAGAEGEAQRATVEAKSLRHVSLLTLVTLPVVGVAMAVLIPLLYGSEFDGAVVLGVILLPGVALFGIASVLAATINGRGHPELSLRAAIWSTPPAIVLYAVLIPLLGDTGAAIASTASYALNFAVTAVVLPRRHRRPRGAAARADARGGAPTCAPSSERQRVGHDELLAVEDAVAEQVEVGVGAGRELLGAGRHPGDLRPVGGHEPERDHRAEEERERVAVGEVDGRRVQAAGRGGEQRGELVVAAEVVREPAPAVVRVAGHRDGHAARRRLQPDRRGVHADEVAAVHERVGVGGIGRPDDAHVGRQRRADPRAQLVGGRLAGAPARLARVHPDDEHDVRPPLDGRGPSRRASRTSTGTRRPCA